MKIIGLLSRNTKFKQPQWCVQCLECWWGHCVTGPSPLKLFVGTSAHWFLSSPVKSLQKKRLLRSASLVNIAEIGDDFTIWFKSNWVSVSRLFLTAAKFWNRSCIPPWCYPPSISSGCMGILLITWVPLLMTASAMISPSCALDIGGNCFLPFLYLSVMQELTPVGYCQFHLISKIFMWSLFL